MQHLRLHRPITNLLIRRHRNPLHHLPDIRLIALPRSLGNGAPPLVQRDGLEIRRDAGLLREDAREFGEGEFGRHYRVGFGGGFARAFFYYCFLGLVGLLAGFSFFNRREREGVRESIPAAYLPMSYAESTQSAR